VTILRQGGTTIDQTLSTGRLCNNGPGTLSISARVSDDRDGSKVKGVTVSWSGFATGSKAMSPDGDWFGTIGPINFPGNNRGGTLTITVRATDTGGLSGSANGSAVTVVACSIVT
jgi:putative peptide zinc metalloprotease protein